MSRQRAPSVGNPTALAGRRASADYPAGLTPSNIMCRMQFSMQNILLGCEKSTDGVGSPDTWAFGERDTVIAALDRAVAAHPNRILLDFGGEIYTYADVDRRATR